MGSILMIPDQLALGVWRPISTSPSSLAVSGKSRDLSHVTPEKCDLVWQKCEHDNTLKKTDMETNQKWQKWRLEDTFPYQKGDFQVAC